MRWRTKNWTNALSLALMLSGSLFLPGFAGEKPAAAPSAKPSAIPAAERKAKASAPVQAPASASVPVSEGKADYNFPLSVLVGVELLGIAYLIFQIKRLKTELLTERQQHVQINQKLEYQALYDALTQLPNRRLFRDRLLQTMKIYNRHKTQFGVIMCDLDHFKEVNDTLGHDAGDMLLVEVTTRLRKALRDSDTLARLGGDEFALICPSVQDMSTASVVCMRLLDCMRDPIVIKGQAFDIGLSLGIAVFPAHASDDEMLVRRADMALYRAKQKRGTFVMYDPNIDRPKKRGEKKD